MGGVCGRRVPSERIPRGIAFSKALHKSRKEIFFFSFCIHFARIFITHLVLSSEQYLRVSFSYNVRAGLSSGGPEVFPVGLF